MKFPPESASSFERAPAGNFPAVCYQIVDLGTQQTNYGLKRQIQFAWELSELMSDGRPYSIRSQRMTLSANEKATLRLMLESWRGRPFTTEELKTFQIEKVLGQPCLLNVVHETNEATQKTYANIAACTPLPPGMPVPQATNPLVLVDLDNFDPAAFAALGEHLQTTIATSPEYQQLTATTAAPTTTATAEPTQVHEYDETDHVDCPF